MLTMAEMYAVFKRHPRVLGRSARSFVWLYETYTQTAERFGEDSPHAHAWQRMALDSARNELGQKAATRRLNLGAAGAYLNDDVKPDCSGCKLGDCRGRGRHDRGAHCPKNTYGDWIHRPPRVI